MNPIEKLSQDQRITVRTPGAPAAEGNCVVYWMQRAQRAHDNPALDVAIQVGQRTEEAGCGFSCARALLSACQPPALSFPGRGIPDIAEDLAARGVGFVLRTYPDHSLLKFCEEVRPAIVIGDENPMREPERWRVKVANQVARALLDGGCGCDRAHANCC